jgi:hypothetical protein
MKHRHKPIPLNKLNLLFVANRSTFSLSINIWLPNTLSLKDTISFLPLALLSVSPFSSGGFGGMILVVGMDAADLKMNDMVLQNPSSRLLFTIMLLCGGIIFFFVILSIGLF